MSVISDDPVAGSVTFLQTTGKACVLLELNSRVLILKVEILEIA